MKENKDIEKNERRLRIIRDALFIVIPLIIIVFIFLTYIKDIKTIINEVDTLRYEMNSVLTSIKSNDSEMLEASADHIDESSKHMQYILLEKKWKLLSHIPYIKKYIRSANTIVDIIVNASDDVLKPGVEVMKQYPLSQLKSGDGFRVDTINAYLDYLEKIEPEIEDMTSSISQVKVTFSKSENISKYTPACGCSLSWLSPPEQPASLTYVCAFSSSIHIRIVRSLPPSIKICAYCDIIL